MAFAPGHSTYPVVPDFRVAVATGQVHHYESFRKFAMNPDISAGTEQIWPLGTMQILPTVAATASVVSDSGTDTLLGVGARTILIAGLDSNFNHVSEEVEMDGLTPVVTTQEFFRIFRVIVERVGTSEVNTGNITISIAGNPQAYVESEEGQTHISQYTVPAGFSLVVSDLFATAGRVQNADLSFQFQTRAWTGTEYLSWRSLVDAFPYEGTLHLFATPFVIPSKSDIRAIATSTGANLNLSVEYHGYLVRDNQIKAERSPSS